MKIQAFGKTDIGHKRSHNTDNFKIHLSDRESNGIGIFTIADGGSDHDYSEVASRLFCKRAVELVSEIEAYGQYSIEHDKELRDQLLQIHSKLAAHIGSEIYTEAETDPELRGMSTSGIILVTVDEAAFLAHAGNIRAYLQRKEKIFRLTEDHISQIDLLKIKSASAKETINRRISKVVNRAWGASPSVSPDTLYVKLEPADRIILCTDGLHDKLLGKDILSISKKNESGRDMVDNLIAEANKQNSSDNITALLIEISQDNESRSSTKVELHTQLDHLFKVFLFKDLNKQEIMRLMRVTHLIEVPQNTIIIQEGDIGQDFYIVLKGQASVIKEEEVLTVISAGGHFGELALIDDLQRSATIISKTDMVLLNIKRCDLMRLLKEDSKIGNKLLMNFISNLSTRVRELSEFSKNRKWNI